MTLKVFLAALFLLFMSSCAPKHYVDIQGDTLLFYFSDSKAEEVLFASSPDNFQYHTAHRSDDSLWVVSVPVRESFRYFYRVDGVIITPDCQQKEYDDFGAKNCLYSSDM